jgi:molecular chaperone GrpE
MDVERSPDAVPAEVPAAGDEPPTNLRAEDDSAAATAVEPMPGPEPEPADTIEGQYAPKVLGMVLERLAGIEAGIAEFHQRSAYREAVIDRLHQDNQLLRSGERRALLEPVVADLIRLYDALEREAARLEAEPDGSAATGALLRGFASEVELILDRCGIERFSAEAGDPYRAGEHRPLSVVPVADPARHNTLAVVLAPGFRDRDSGRVKRPVHARFHQYKEQGDQPSDTRPEPQNLT